MLPFKQGTLVPSPDGFIGPFSVDSNGLVQLSGTWPPGVPLGAAIVSQWFVNTGAVHGGLSATDGIVGIAE